jgi:predicted NAD-dependent protein-ADP-ribosyltransferase YbiA (DUF1768 family)
MTSTQEEKEEGSHILKIFDPSELPFGKLSLNAYQPMNIGEKRYMTVTNYILSNMLTVPLYKTHIQNTEIKPASNTNTELLKSINYLIGLQNPTEIKHIGQQGERDQLVVRMTKLLGVSPDKLDRWTRGELDSALRMYRVLNTREPDKQRVAKHLKRAWRKYLETNTPSSFNKALGEKFASPNKDVGAQARDADEDFLELAETGKLKEAEDEYEKKQKIKAYIQSEVRKPFDQINLYQLRDELVSKQRMDNMGIYQAYNSFVNKELRETLSVATKNGYESRFSKPELGRILLATGNSPIIYQSSDKFLGIGNDGNGHNIIGKSLVQVRQNLRQKDKLIAQTKKDQQKYKYIYDTYVAYIALRTEITQNKSDLTEYLGKTPAQIISQYGPEKLSKGIPTQETVIELYKIDKLPHIVMKEIFQPNSLVINMRKDSLRDLQYQLKDMRNDIIFDEYLKYMIIRNYEDDITAQTEKLYEAQKTQDKALSDNKKIRKAQKKSRDDIQAEIIDDAIIRQKREQDPDSLDKIKARVIDLFKLGMLSASLSDTIDKNIEKLQIPTDQEVEEAEIAEIVPSKAKSKQENLEEKESRSSNDSSGNEVTKSLKTMLKDDKDMRKSDLITLLLEEKGGERSDYTKMSLEQLRLELEEKQFGNISIKQDDTAIGAPIIIHKELASNNSELQTLAPDAYTGMLSIENLFFPTIQHYIIAKLISKTGTKNISNKQGDVSVEKGIGIYDAHAVIMTDTTSDVNIPQSYLTLPLAGEKYSTLENETNILLWSTFTIIGLNKKFEDPSLQNLLLLTDNKEIQWDSTDNLFLGIHNNVGNNYVGKTMMDIREKLKVSKQDEEVVEINEEDLLEFVNRDSFMIDWITMRVKDMCGIVNKLQTYLKTKDDIDVDLQYDNKLIKLINFVLDEVYQPCNPLVEQSKKVEIPVPDFVVNIVSKCRGMKTGLQPVYNQDRAGQRVFNSEIQTARSNHLKRLAQLDRDFLGSKKTEHTQQESQDFDNHQRDDWTRFMNKINDDTQYSEDEDSDDESHESHENHKKGKGKKGKSHKNKDKNTIGIGPNKHAEMEEFAKQQKAEYDEFWGVEPPKRGKHDEAIYINEKTQINKEWADYIRDMERKEKHYVLIIKEISQLYWDRIVVMINTLIQNLRVSSTANIKDTLVKVEEMVSEKSTCVRIVQDEEDNCIISAILNLLVGIKKFKEVFSGNMTLDDDDVRLAGSVIINSQFSALHVNVDEEISLDEEKEDETKEEDHEFVVDEEGVFPSENDADHDQDNVDYEADNATFDFRRARFGAKKTTSHNDLAKVEQQVLLITNKKSQLIAETILQTVKIIKADRLSQKIKQNRINFFATIR